MLIGQLLIQIILPICFKSKHNWNDLLININLKQEVVINQ